MTDLLPARSALAKILSRQRLTVAELMRRIEEKGFRFDRKTIYRLASDEPVRNLNLSVIAAIGSVLKLRDPGQLIDWPPTAHSPPRLQRIDAGAQARLDELMTKNTEGALEVGERRELERLGRMVEKLSLENARLIARHTPAKIPKKRNSTPARRHSSRHGGAVGGPSSKTAAR